MQVAPERVPLWEQGQGASVIFPVLPCLSFPAAVERSSGCLPRNRAGWQSAQNAGDGCVSHVCSIRWKSQGAATSTLG